jgi:hypothetical protein
VVTPELLGYLHRPWLEWTTCSLLHNSLDLIASYTYVVQVELLSRMLSINPCEYRVILEACKFIWWPCCLVRSKYTCRHGRVVRTLRAGQLLCMSVIGLGRQTCLQYDASPPSSSGPAMPSSHCPQVVFMMMCIAVCATKTIEVLQNLVHPEWKPISHADVLAQHVKEMST